MKPNNVMPIKWHKECLENRKNFLKKEKKYINGLIYKIQQSEKEIKFLEYQISEAIKADKNEFDADRWRVKKNGSI